MNKHEFVVLSRGHKARVVVSGDGNRSGVAFGGEEAEVEGEQTGTALWEVMRAGGLNANKVNCFEVCEGSSEGRLIASLRPVLEGARVVWLVLYRADKDSSAFRALGSRQRIGDAMNLCFEELRREVVLPHKP